MKKPAPSSASQKAEGAEPRPVFRLLHTPSLLRPFSYEGLTLIEIMIAIAILGILVAMATTAYMGYTKKADIAKAVYHISNIASDIKIYQAETHGVLPETLDDLGRPIPEDPWGNPYQYQDVNEIPKGKRRKDKFLVPLNSDYDLWSMGPDGESRPPLTAKASRDDIIRAGDGRFIGIAEKY